MLDREFRTIAVKKRISEEQQFIHRIAQLFDPNLLILKQNLGFSLREVSFAAALICLSASS
jgi:hypothetical protein